MKFFVVGDLCLDVLCNIKEHAGLGEEKHIEDLTFSLGGNAANFSFAAAKLKLNVELFSAIGKDFATRFLKAQLKKAHVKAYLRGVPTQNAYSIILVEKKGQRAIYSSKGALEKITAHGIEKALLPKLRANDLVYFGGYFHLYALHTNFLHLLEKIKQKNCFVAFDLCCDEFNKWNILNFLHLTDFLFLNELELRNVSKKKKEKEAIKFLLGKGVDFVILKKGPKGASFFSQNYSFHAPALDVKNPVDTTGAGDIFDAAFLKEFFSSHNARKALAFGNIVAAQKITRHGLFVP